MSLATRIAQEFNTVRDEMSSLDVSSIVKPTITSPSDGTIDFTGNIVAVYTTSDSYTGVQDYVHWQVSTDNTFDTIDYEYEGSSNLTVFSPDITGSLVTYYVRVKQGSDNHVSVWSSVTSFTTSEVFVETPAVVVTGSPDSVSETPTISTSAFSVYNGTDTHESTDWQVTLPDDTVVWESLNNTANLLSIGVPSSILSESTEYVFKAKHNGTTYGASSWNSTTATTVSAFATAYGVEWDPSTDTYTRTGDTVNTTQIQDLMKRCVLDSSGTVKYYLDPTDSTKKENGDPAIIDGSDGNVMVEIPKFYFKYENTAGVRHWSVSLKQETGYSLHPAFNRGGIEKDYRYYCAYAGRNNGGTLISGSGLVPTANQAIVTFRTQAEANGIGWSLIDWNLLYAVQLLYLTEYADFNTQANLGNGNDTGSDYGMTTGGSNSIGNASSPATNDGTWMSYRGIENWYADLRKFIDGVIVREREYFISNNPATFAFGGDYVTTGVTGSKSNGYISNINNTSSGFIPSEASGSVSTLIPDRYFYSTGVRVVLFGGYAGDGLGCGGFFLHAAFDSDYSSVSVGSGVVF